MRIFTSPMRYIGLAGLVIGSATAMQAQTIAPEQRPKALDGYRRYLVPTQCLSAIDRESVLIWRIPALRDTLPYALQLQQENLPAASVTAAKECLVRMQARSLSRDQQITLAQVALIAERNEVASQLTESVIATSSQIDTTADRLWNIGRILGGYQNPNAVQDGAGVVWPYKPLRYAEALQSVQRKLSCDMIELCQLRIGAYTPLRRHYRGLGDFTQAATMSNNLVTDHQALLAHPKMGRSHDGKIDIHERLRVTESFMDLYDDTYLSTGHMNARSILDRSRDALVKLGENPDSPFEGWWENVSNRWYLFTDSLFRKEQLVQFPTLTPTVWLRRSDTLAPPASGQVRLVLVGGQNALAWIGSDVLNVFEQVAILRRLYDRYAARGFEIVWLMESKGSFRDSPVLTFEEEQRELKSFWFDYLRAPGIIALDKTEFEKRHDGMLLPQPTVNRSTVDMFRDRSGYLFEDTFLLDRAGNVVTTMRGLKIEVSMEITLARLIEQALGK